MTSDPSFLSPPGPVTSDLQLQLLWLCSAGRVQLPRQRPGCGAAVGALVPGPRLTLCWESRGRAFQFQDTPQMPPQQDQLSDSLPLHLETWTLSCVFSVPETGRLEPLRMEHPACGGSKAEAHRAPNPSRVSPNDTLHASSQGP